MRMARTMRLRCTPPQAAFSTVCSSAGMLGLQILGRMYGQERLKPPRHFPATKENMIWPWASASPIPHWPLLAASNCGVQVPTSRRSLLQRLLMPQGLPTASTRTSTRSFSWKTAPCTSREMEASTAATTTEVLTRLATGTTTSPNFMAWRMAQDLVFWVEPKTMEVFSFQVMDIS